MLIFTTLFFVCHSLRTWYFRNCVKSR